MSNYRKIWEEYNNKKIPKGYHIHHIDGDHCNNDPLNLLCVSPEEHWEIHFKQGDMIAVNGKFIQGAAEAGKRGGSKGKGKTISDEQRRVHSESMKAHYRKIGGSWNKGRKSSEETKKRISSQTTGEKNPMFRRKHSNHSKKVMSNNIKAKFDSGERLPHPTVHTDDTKKKISEKRKVYFENGGVSPWANVYDVVSDSIMIQNKTKSEILEIFSISDRQFTTAYTFCKRNPNKIHPSSRLKIESKGKYHATR